MIFKLLKPQVYPPKKYELITCILISVDVAMGT
jgi:hypothetical protein